MTDKEKLIKIKSLADKMYDAAFNLTTDASLLRKAMDDYHQFIINEYHKEEPVSDECIYNRTLEEKQKSCKFYSAACQVRIKEEPVSEEWIEELRAKLNSMSKEDFKKVFDKYAVDFKEESASEELEEAAEDYAVTDEVLPNGKVMINFQVEKAFKAGAKWQKEQFEKNRIAHCDELTAEQAQIERDFVIEHLKKNNRTPTFIDAIEYGMKVRKVKR